MKLVTFQSIEALKFLVNNGYLACDERLIHKEKYGIIYDWIADKIKMENPANAKYPLWAWVKCYNHICPPKRKGESVKGFDVKITFSKEEKDVFITDFRRYSFLLNNIYIPKDLEDKRNFDEALRRCHITKEELKAFVRKDKYKNHRTDPEYIQICQQIRQSFDRCITKDSDVLQGCVWSIHWNEIQRIEILNDKSYTYGSLNDKRANGKRIDWISDFYKKLR